MGLSKIIDCLTKKDPVIGQVPWDKVFIEDEAEIESQGKEIPPKTVLSAYCKYLQNSDDSEIGLHGCQKGGEYIVDLFLDLCELYFGKRPCGKLLDVGCGTGYLTECFRQKGFDVLGCDILQSAILVAKSKYPDCEFQVFNARYPTGFGEKRFDVIHMREFYPFTRNRDFERQKNLILDYCNILNKDGYMVIIGSNWCVNRHMDYYKMVAYLNKNHKGKLRAVGPFYGPLHRYFPWIRQNKLLIKTFQPLWRIICWAMRKYPSNYLIIRKSGNK